MSLFPTLLETFQNSYPELERAKDLILSTFLNEETKFKETVEKGLKILEEEGFISSFDMVDQDKFKFININLKYNDRKVSVIKEIKRVSKPGLRVYVNKNEIPRVRGGLGTSIISTSKGVMTGNKARAIGVGGEVLCKIV